MIFVQVTLAGDDRFVFGFATIRRARTVLHGVGQSVLVKSLQPTPRGLDRAG